MKADPFLSCDWGTSSFRLRLVEGAGLRVLKEVKTGDGVRSIFEKGGERARNFEEFLFGQLQGFEAEAGTPLIISGMASSTIGWKELPYAKIPVELNGAGLIVQSFDWPKPAWVGKTFLISGVSNGGTEIMRGEETQVVGLMASGGLADLREKCVLVLPGTHSKHVWILSGKVQHLGTYMTGELFEVLGRHSVLKASVDPAVEVEIDSHFFDGVMDVQTFGLARGLFQTRTRQVLRGQPREKNTSYLSGMLIGAELNNLSEHYEWPIVIAATGRLSALYAEGMRIIAENVALVKKAKLSWRVAAPEEIDRATVRAHGLILGMTNDKGAND